ncbi:MAG: tetrahydromethanopterin S-methyltransferase subunit H [Candidatus Hydrothermarchaeales archaeon]
MFRFETEQTVYDIGGVKVGGQPGENATVLLGTMFYTGHKIIESRKKAKFDKKRAEELINRQETLSDQTGIPGMLDLVANFPEEIRTYIDFVTSVTEMPFSIDIWKVKPKLAAAEYIKETGLIDRTIYSSIAPWSEDMEREVVELKKLGLKNAILVAYNVDDKTVQGRIDLLESTLLPNAKAAGFKNFLIDTSVLSIPASAFSFLGNLEIKKRYGYPTGCAPSNGTDMWRKFVIPTWGKTGFSGVDSAAHAVAPLLWNDWLLYGPIENAGWIFPAVATSNAILSTLVYDEVLTLPESDDHPLNKLFPDLVGQLKKEKGQ